MKRSDDIFLDFLCSFVEYFILLVGQRFGSWTWNNSTELQRKHAAGCFDWKGKVYTNAVGYGGTSEKVPGVGNEIEVRRGLVVIIDLNNYLIWFHFGNL